MASSSRVSYTDLLNPLFLHPSDGPLSISVSKLQGTVDYRAWKRQFEIQVSAKRKLGFVDGSVTRSTTDINEAAQWDTVNNMVISWIHNNVSDTIKSSILFISTASEIWSQLAKRFSLTNGSHKYKLSRDLFNLKQNGAKVHEYFTSLSSLWEELDSMNGLPTVDIMTPNVTKLLMAIQTMKEEAKLFQFLNGLDDLYGPQRSQLLMMSPLPSVEMACAAVQQEESQREVLNQSLVSETDVSAMYSKGSTEKVMICVACGLKGHTRERCWTVAGYPKWHHKYRKPGQKFVSNKPGVTKMANNAQGTVNSSDEVTMTTHQLEQLLKLLPKDSSKRMTLMRSSSMFFLEW